MSGLEYNTAVVLAGTATLGLAAGATGSLALLRRRALLADALAHATLPGICLGFLVAGGRSFPALLLGALATGVLGVLVVVGVSRRGRIREDAAIGIVLGSFFGAGIALSGAIQRRSTDAAQAGLDGFLLGRTAGMVRADVLWIAGIAIATVALIAALAKEWKLICFDPDFAAVDGWPVRRLDLLLMLLITVTVVIALPAVGVVLTAALLIIPPAAARLWTGRLAPMLVIASLFGVMSGAAGTAISAQASSLPAGPVIVLSASSIFAVSLLFAPRRGVISRVTARRRRERRREEGRLLGAIWEALEENPGRPVGESELLRRRSFGPGRLRALLERARARGWVEWLADGVTLTAAGRAAALRRIRAERIWQEALRTQARIDRDLIDLDAEEIGRALPPGLVHELEASLRERGRLPAPGPGESLPGPPTRGGA